MNIPNALTVLRMVLVPIFAYLFRQGLPEAALIVYIAAAATDALDGYLARRYHQITVFGKLVDPLADKLMQLTMLFCLTDFGFIPMWLLLVMLARDLYLIVGSVYLYRRDIVIHSEIWGKAAMVLLVVGILAVYPWHRIAWLRAAGGIALIVAVACSLIACFMYTKIAIAQMRDAANDSANES